MKKLLYVLTFICISGIGQSVLAQTPSDSWAFGFGGIYPRFQSTDVRPAQSNYGFYLSIQRNVTENVAFRLKAGYDHITGLIPGPPSSFRFTNGNVVPFETEVHSNLILGDFDFMYYPAPCGPVSPFFFAGLGVVHFSADWGDVVNPEAEDAVVAEFNMGLGADIKIGEDWKFTGEFSFHSLDGRFDGVLDNDRKGIFGSSADGYVALNLGFLYFFDKGPASKWCDLYTGLKVDFPSDYATKQDVEDIVRKYACEPVDYKRIEDIVKKYKTEVGAQMAPNWVLFGVNFAFDKATLLPESYPILQHASEVLKENPDLNVEIQGYTDAIGSDKYNQKLSDNRAKTVRDWLVKDGISANRLTTIGYGETKPISDNSTETGRAQNRRVEFKVTNK